MATRTDMTLIVPILTVKQPLLQHFWNGVMYYVQRDAQLYLKNYSFDQSYSLSFKLN